MTDRLDARPALWLVLGAVLLIASQMRFGLGVLAWLAPVPWLRYLRLTTGWRSRLGLTLALLVAWTLAVLKIVTAPVPAVLAVGFSLPIMVTQVLPLFGWSLVRRRLGESWATLSLPVLMVVGEWTLHGLLPFGTWGTAANTQVDQLALLQLASVTGIHGVSAIVYAVAAVLERALHGERRSMQAVATAVATTTVLVVAAGQARLVAASGHAVPTRLVAAVGTDGVVGTTPTLPDRQQLAKVEQGLVERTELAAGAGAKLVVWNEAATMTYPEDEAAWLRRLQALAARLDIDLVAAYVVPRTTDPLLYENKYVFVRSDGSIHHTYLKHEPVPGEPAVRGEALMPLVDDGERGSVGGAICYDYDFPRLALANAQNAVDLVALPSSDWRGIDPIHTQMATLRAIEGGHSVVRSTRFGLSAGIDPWGRLRGWSSHFDDEERVLLVRLPRRGVTTPYARLGDWFPLLCGLLSLSLLGAALRRRP